MYLCRLLLGGIPAIHKGHLIFWFIRSRSDFAPCSGTKMDFLQTRQCPQLKMFINNEEKVLTIVKSATNLELVLQQLVRK